MTDDYMNACHDYREAVGHRTYTYNLWKEADDLSILRRRSWEAAEINVLKKKTKMLDMALDTAKNGA